MFFKGQLVGRRICTEWWSVNISYDYHLDKGKKCQQTLTVAVGNMTHMRASDRRKCKPSSTRSCPSSLHRSKTRPWCKCSRAASSATLHNAPGSRICYNIRFCRLRPSCKVCSAPPTLHRNTETFYQAPQLQKKLLFFIEQEGVKFGLIVY